MMVRSRYQFPGFRGSATLSLKSFLKRNCRTWTAGKKSKNCGTLEISKRGLSCVGKRYFWTEWPFLKYLTFTWSTKANKKVSRKNEFVMGWLVSCWKQVFFRRVFGVKNTSDVWKKGIGPGPCIIPKRKLKKWADLRAEDALDFLGEVSERRKDFFSRSAQIEKIGAPYCKNVPRKNK